MDTFAGYRLALVFTLAVLAPSTILALVSLSAIAHEREAARARLVERAREEGQRLAERIERRAHEPLLEADRALEEAARRAPTPRALAEAAQGLAAVGRVLRAAAVLAPGGAPLAPAPLDPPGGARAAQLDAVFRAVEDLEARRADPVGALERLAEIERGSGGDETVLAEALAQRARLHARIDGFPHNAYDAYTRIIQRYPLARDRDGAVLSLGARLEVAAIWRRLGDAGNAARALEDLLGFIGRHEEELRPREARFYREAAIEGLRALDPSLAARAALASEAAMRDREASRALREAARGPLLSRLQAALDAAPALRPGGSAQGAPAGTIVRGEGGRPLVYARPLLVEAAPPTASAAPVASLPRALLGTVLLEIDADLLRLREAAALTTQAASDDLVFRLEPRGAAPPEPPPEDLVRERLRPPLEDWDVLVSRRAGAGRDELLPLAERVRIWAVVLLLVGLAVGAVVMTRAVWRERKGSELKSDFVTTVTHELKTPLTSIGMFAETLLMGRVTDEEERRECLEIIAKETDRLTRLIDRVLTFSKIEAGTKRFDLRLTDMHELCAETVELFETRMRGVEARGASRPPQIGITVIHELKDVLCDRGSVQEVLLNLLSNAYKYGGEEKRIEVTLRRKRRWAMIEVRDWGSGIPRGEQRRIFRKFYRTDNRLTRDVEGSGIGLTLAQAIARGHRGDITVRSKLGAGSTFTLWLPR
jgi:signal transduction histidine kinase